MIRSALWESAERGDAVIVAHAASLALATRTDVLRVLITASPETRVRRLAGAQNIGETEAEQQVARADANRADYLKRFYGVSTELPTHYDIVLNTDHVAPEDAGALILSAARSEPVRPKRSAPVLPAAGQAEGAGVVRDHRRAVGVRERERVVEPEKQAGVG